ncbi:response regulator [Enterobacter cloacae]|uniref:response regulator n=1 Tax=Enterobacter cloacae TaxID=550 RepID=UPI001F5C11DF|nr:transporter substrate-binding domain-containing protein [Enterobacter cloacae]
MKVVAALFFLLLLVGQARADLPFQSLRILSRENYTPVQLHLDDETWRWLGQKQKINVAVWRPSIPPLDMFSDDGRYEGITADYVLLLTQFLGLRVDVREYPDRGAAIAALKQGAVDMVVDSAGKMYPLDNTLTHTDRIVGDNPVLIHPRKDDNTQFHYRKGMTLAISRWYVDYIWLEQQFPHAKIVQFDSDDAALASVAFGTSDFYIGSLVASTYLVDRNYSAYLDVQESFPEHDTGSRFVMRRDQSILLNAINQALMSISDPQHQIILQQWGERAGLWQVRKKLVLTSQEKQWLAANSTVNVSVNAFYAPFTMINNAGSFYGVTADVLRLVQLRTGIHFRPVPSREVDDMVEQVAGGQAAFIGAFSDSPERRRSLLFSRPYFNSPFVLVVRAKRERGSPLTEGERVALVQGNALQSELKSKYPGIKIVPAPNANVAMQWVDEGKVDAAVNNLFGASYMIDHYFKNRLRVEERVGKDMAAIRFAVGRNQPELLSILNKSLENITPNNMSGILTRWQARPDTILNTWALYRMQFWLVAAGAAIILLTSALWIFYLRREIAARQRAKRSLRSQLMFNEALLSSVPIPLYVVDREGKLVMSNSACGDFFKGDFVTHWNNGPGHPKNPMHGVWINAQPLFNRRAQGHQTETVTIFDGEQQRTVVHYVVPFERPDTHIDSLICAWIDITDHQELALALSQARENAEHANRAKSTFLATMSHEIRTPVSAIIGLLELAVKQSGKVSDNEDPVHVAWESARSLMGVIGDILDMARIESGRLELSPEWLRTADLLLPVARVFEGLARQKGLRLRSVLPVDPPYEIFVDPVRVRQVISNLVSNAIKFTSYGGVDIDMEIVASANDEESQLTIRVTDTGSGIAEAEQAGLFNPWVQAKNGQVSGGSGLGLAICAQLVEMMGGTISLTSQLNHGTTVRFTIPVQQNNERPVVVAQSEPESTRHNVTLQILIVDDHPANRLLLRSQLTHLGHQVTEAKDGEEGWQAWQQKSFDLIITDCSMPGMDGFALTRLIREHEQQHSVIMGLTANAWPEERLRCQNAGMDDCLFKPLQLHQLQLMLENVVQHMEPSYHPHTVNLETLVNYEGLRSLTQNDENLLAELLRATLTSNRHDLLTARECVEKQDWPALKIAIHRLSGAAQIIGAQETAEECIHLESLCMEDEPDPVEIIAVWQDAQQHVDVLNRALDVWLSSRSLNQ